MPCGHCGFPGELVQKANCVLRSETVEEPHGEEVEWTENARIMVCPACSRPTLDVYDWSDWLDPEAIMFRVLYPPRRDYSALPSAVRNEYDKTQHVKAMPE